MNAILVTGAAGFIGFHLSAHLLRAGRRVVGIDNLNDYYEVSLKQARLRELAQFGDFHFEHLDVGDRAMVNDLFAKHKFDVVHHLAAQAGVRYSLTNPHAYAHSNLDGFLNILESCRHNSIKHLVFASSSSVYGANTKTPFSTKDTADHPVSLYAATKRANELMAHSYAHLFRIPITGLRFFTVYGPWGRPDMALFLFTRAILEGRAIDVFNGGQMQRDFTYVDDVVEAIARVGGRPAEPDSNWSGDNPRLASSTAPYRIYNIGNHCPVPLNRLIELIEAALGKAAIRNVLPMQPGDVPITCADVDDLMRDVGFAPSTPIEVGVARFVDWYKKYYGM